MKNLSQINNYLNKHFCDGRHRFYAFIVVLSFRFFIGYWINTGLDVYPALLY